MKGAPEKKMSELVTCTQCGSEWDGNAQCPCWMDSDSDIEEDPNPEVETVFIDLTLE